MITGELYRRLGPTRGPLIAEARERINVLFRQTEQDTRMDRTDNAIVVNERPRLETWEDVVEWARAKVIESAARNGDGEDGRAAWYEEQPPDWQPDFTDVPITPIEKGGAEHRYPGKSGLEEPMGMAEASDPLDRPVVSWTEEDVRTAINSPAYLQPRHPKHQQVQRDVRAWFEHRVGTGPVPVDATGRAIHGARETTARAGACPVPVRAHNRGESRCARIADRCRLPEGLCRQRIASGYRRPSRFDLVSVFCLVDYYVRISHPFIYRLHGSHWPQPASDGATTR